MTGSHKRDSQSVGVAQGKPTGIRSGVRGLHDFAGVDDAASGVGDEGVCVEVIAAAGVFGESSRRHSARSARDCKCAEQCTADRRPKPFCRLHARFLCPVQTRKAPKKRG
jgi:hypothetical protein